MGGHVIIEDEVYVGGMVGIHQMVRIGAHAFIGGFSRVIKDMPPYMIGQGGDNFELHGPNSIGLRRKGFTRETISALKEAFRMIFRSQRPQHEVLEEVLAEFAEVPEVRNLVDFIKASKRGVYK